LDKKCGKNKKLEQISDSIKSRSALTPDFHYENQSITQGYKLIAGVDEVGRGPLAGPVVAAAVILDANHLPQAVRDSKRLSPARRAQLVPEILASARAVSLSVVCATDIDNSNIRQATLLAMRRALAGLEPAPDFALIDGRDLPPALPCPAQAIIKGDTLSLSIASAAIIAKVLRDKMMKQVADTFPDYGFDKHVGYGTQFHTNALSLYGPLPKIHRFSFSPIKDMNKP